MKNIKNYIKKKKASLTAVKIILIKESKTI